jgi:hypothetical protein
MGNIPSTEQIMINSFDINKFYLIFKLEEKLSDYVNKPDKYILHHKERIINNYKACGEIPHLYDDKLKMIIIKSLILSKNPLEIFESDNILINREERTIIFPYSLNVELPIDLICGLRINFNENNQCSPIFKFRLYVSNIFLGQYMLPSSELILEKEKVILFSRIIPYYCIYRDQISIKILAINNIESIHFVCAILDTKQRKNFRKHLFSI